MTEFIIYTQKNDIIITNKQQQNVLSLLLPFTGIYKMVELLYTEYSYFKKNPEDNFMDYIQNEKEK